MKIIKCKKMYRIVIIGNKQETTFIFHFRHYDAGLFLSISLATLQIKKRPSNSFKGASPLVSPKGFLNPGVPLRVLYNRSPFLCFTTEAFIKGVQYWSPLEGGLTRDLL